MTSGSPPGTRVTGTSWASAAAGSWPTRCSANGPSSSGCSIPPGSPEKEQGPAERASSEGDDSDASCGRRHELALRRLPPRLLHAAREQAEAPEGGAPSAGHDDGGQAEATAADDDCATTSAAASAHCDVVEQRGRLRVAYT